MTEDLGDDSVLEDDADDPHRAPAARVHMKGGRFRKRVSEDEPKLSSEPAVAHQKGRHPPSLLDVPALPAPLSRCYDGHVRRLNSAPDISIDLG
jgi:hypothetical protein